MKSALTSKEPASKRKPVAVAKVSVTAKATTQTTTTAKGVADPLSITEAYAVRPEDYYLNDPGLCQVNHETWHSTPNGTLTADVFIVHGHDEDAKTSVKCFLKTLKVNPIILEEQPNIGTLTIIEKFLHYSAGVTYAVVLLTADDGDCRPRPNVLIELGYFMAKLGREHVCLLKGHGVEIPSDLLGVLYIELDAKRAWEAGLKKEMKEAGLRIEMDLPRSA